MARALYREWFVHFRFPGHEKLPRVASPLGDIPQGWEMQTSAISFNSNPVARYHERDIHREGEHRLVTIRNVQDSAFNPECDSLRANCTQNLPSYCVLGDSRHPLHQLRNVGRVCRVHNGPCHH